jgi:hypothetical protein
LLVFPNPFQGIFVPWSEPLAETIFVPALGLALARRDCA